MNQQIMRNSSGDLINPLLETINSNLVEIHPEAIKLLAELGVNSQDIVTIVNTTENLRYPYPIEIADTLKSLNIQITSVDVAVCEATISNMFDPSKPYGPCGDVAQKLAANLQQRLGDTYEDRVSLTIKTGAMQQYFTHSTSAGNAGVHVWVELAPRQLDSSSESMDNRTVVIDPAMRVITPYPDSGYSHNKSIPFRLLSPTDVATLQVANLFIDATSIDQPDQRKETLSLFNRITALTLGVTTDGSHIISLGIANLSVGTMNLDQPNAKWGAFEGAQAITPFIRLSGPQGCENIIFLNPDTQQITVLGESLTIPQQQEIAPITGVLSQKLPRITHSD